MRILLVGYGKMGRLVGELAPQYGCEVVGVMDPQSPSHGGGPDAPQWNGVDVAIDFSIPAVVVGNAAALARRGINLVIGTTGWQNDESSVRQAARLFAGQTEFGAFLHEAHHATKKDAPSGTALLLKQTMERAGFPRLIDISSTRAGFIPGTHTVGFDGPAETVTLSHTARDRTAFARGAIAAAKWVTGKRGWFNMRDVLGIGPI